jgi:hypothetical protein
MMASFECDIDVLDIGQIDSIEKFCGGSHWQPMDKRPMRMVLVAKDGTKIECDMPKGAPADAIDLLEFLWLSLNYGGEGEENERALADLRAAKVAQEARASGEQQPCRQFWAREDLRRNYISSVLEMVGENVNPPPNWLTDPTSRLVRLVEISQ